MRWPWPHSAGAAIVPNTVISIFQCLQHTLDLPHEQWRILDQAHRKRNLAEYEGHMEADEALVSAMLRVTAGVAERLGE